MGRPRVKNPSTRGTAAAENSTSVEEEEVDRAPIQVAWNGVFVVIKSLATAPAYAGEAFSYPNT